MHRGNSIIVLVGLAWLSASGCATVVNGTTQKVGIGSNPPGAHVLIDNQGSVPIRYLLPFIPDSRIPLGSCITR